MLTKKISPLTAVLICLNSMIGAGLFINPKPLTAFAGAFGFMGYVLAGCIVFPIILCVAELAALHPVAGGLYVFSKTYVGSFAGFLGAWGYFVGKTTSATVLLHKVIQFFQARIPLLHGVPTFSLDVSALFFIVFLNIVGVSIGGRIQYMFTTLKAIPLFFVFIAGFVYCNPANFVDVAELHGIIATVSIAMFTLFGFEVICSIGNMIEDPARNMRRIILSAFCVVALADILFQISIFGVMGHALTELNEPVLAFGMHVFSVHSLLAQCINGAVFASITGATFSLLTSNCWNLHTLARFGHLPGAGWLTRINRFNVPWVSLIVEACLGSFILWITLDQVPLQSMSVFSQLIAFLFTVIAALIAVRSGAITRLYRWVPVLAIGCCLFAMGVSISHIVKSGISLSFLFVFCLGLLAFGLKQLMARRA